MNSRHKSLFQNLHLDDKSSSELGTLWDSIEHFVTHDLTDGFQAKDIYSLIVVLKNGINVILPDANGETVKSYVVYITNTFIRDLTKRDILPRRVEDLLEQIPVAIIVDLISAVGGGAFMGRFGASQEASVADPAFVGQNWVLGSHKK